jgi:hypothetical protein
MLYPKQGVLGMQLAGRWLGPPPRGARRLQDCGGTLTQMGLFSMLKHKKFMDTFPICSGVTWVSKDLEETNGIVNSWHFGSGVALGEDWYST